MGWLWANYRRLLGPDSLIGHMDCQTYMYIQHNYVHSVSLCCCSSIDIYFCMFHMYIITQYVSHFAYLSSTSICSISINHVYLWSMYKKTLWTTALYNQMNLWWRILYFSQLQVNTHVCREQRTRTHIPGCPTEGFSSAFLSSWCCPYMTSWHDNWL